MAIPIDETTNLRVAVSVTVVKGAMPGAAIVTSTLRPLGTPGTLHVLNPATGTWDHIYPSAQLRPNGNTLGIAVTIAGHVAGNVYTYGILFDQAGIDTLVTKTTSNSMPEFAFRLV